MIGGFVPGASDQCLFGGLEVRRRRESVGRKELKGEKQAEKGKKQIEQWKGRKLG